MVGSSFWLQYRASGCGIGVSVVVGTISGGWVGGQGGRGVGDYTSLKRPY